MIDTTLLITGTHTISVHTSGGTSAALDFVVSAPPPPPPPPSNPLPVVTSVTPTQTPTATIDTQISVFGSNFLPSSSVAIGAEGVPTFYISANQLDATIPASYLGTAGTLVLDVFTPAPGGGFSGTATLTVGTPACSCPANMPCTDCSGTGTCNAGWVDLDRNLKNGCETNVTAGAACAVIVHDRQTCVAAATFVDASFIFERDLATNTDPMGRIAIPALSSYASLGPLPWQFDSTDATHTQYTETGGPANASLVVIDLAGTTVTIEKYDLTGGLAGPTCPESHIEICCAGTTTVALP